VQWLHISKAKSATIAHTVNALKTQLIKGAFWITNSAQTWVLASVVAYASALNVPLGA
jgi:hypothetical protein